MSFFNSWKYEFGNPYDESEYDNSLLIGFGICAFLLVVSLLLSGSFSTVTNPLGLLIVVGGTLGATFVNFSVEEVIFAYNSAKSLLFVKKYNPKEKIKYIVQLAHSIRRDGILCLEHESKRVHDPFLQLALGLVVDAPQEDEIRRVLGVELQISSERNERIVHVFESMGTFAPAMGLIGTLLGLIQMLQSLSDPSTVGPAMAVALVTTLYGAICSNMLFIPVAGKLRQRFEVENREKKLLIEGIISLGRQDNPVVVEQRLQAFVPVDQAA